MKITEALAELKTIGKRIDKKRTFVGTYLTRPEGIKDPLAKDGGTHKVIREEVQAISDLTLRIVNLRRAIQVANDTTMLTIAGTERSISEWLIWRRECAPIESRFLADLNSAIARARADAQRQGNRVVKDESDASAPTDTVVAIDESKLAKDLEKLEETLGDLDGKLSLANATVEVSL